jgi:serine/threonine protein kinase
MSDESWSGATARVTVSPDDPTTVVKEIPIALSSAESPSVAWQKCEEGKAVARQVAAPKAWGKSGVEGSVPIVGGSFRPAPEGTLSSTGRRLLGHYLLSMKKVHGCPGHEVPTPQPAAVVRRLGIILATALHHLHTKQSLVHGDIKPENFILSLPSDDDPSVPPTLALIDFGNARPLRQGTVVARCGDWPSSPLFLCPELRPIVRSAARRATVTGAVDVYAAGVSLVLLLGGGSRLADEPVMRVLQDDAVVDMPEGLSDAWLSVLRALVAPEPADRPTAQRMRELLEELPG